MPFFKKADEMEMEINFKSMRLAWVAENLILVVWMVVLAFRDGDLGMPSIIISVQNLLFFGSKLIMTRRMTRRDEE